MKRNRRITYWGMVLIGILFSTLTISKYNDFYRKELTETLVTVADVAAVDVQTDEDLENNLYDIIDNAVSDLTGFCAYSFGENEYSQVTMNELYSQVKTIGNVYYMHAVCNDENQTATGAFLAATGEKVYNLSETEIYTLCRQGRVECDGFIARSQLVGNDYYAVIIWSPENIVSFTNNGETISDEYGETILYLNETEQGYEVYSANNPEYLHKKATDFLSAAIDIDSLCDNSNATLVTMADGTRGLVIGKRATDSSCVMVIMPVSAMNINLARSVLLPNLLFWIILILMTYFIQKVRQEGVDSEEDDSEYIKVGIKHCIDRRVSSHIGASVVFGMILMILQVIYLQTLINYSNQNIAANSNLHNLEEVAVTNISNREAVEQVYEFCNSMITEAIATYYMEHPKKLSDASLEAMMDLMPNCSEITLYDRSGTSQYTTGAFKGYTLSHDESTAEYKCWELIEGTRNSVTYNADKSDYYVAGRRQDEDGIVRVLLDAQQYLNFMDMMSIEQTVLRASLGRANKIYLLTEDLSRLYFNEYGSDMVFELNNNLPKEALTDGYTGIDRIEGVKYYINTKAGKDYIFICAEKISNIREMAVSYVIRIIILCFVLTYVLFMVTSLKETAKVESAGTVSRGNKEIARSLEEQMLDDSFKKLLRNMVVFSGIALVTLLGIDTATNSDSLLTYLFSSEWSHGINMFSVTMILIMVVLGIVFTAVARTIILYVTQNMGPRGLTIGRMISSLIKLAVLIIVIAKTLIYIGANPSTLLAGAGIAGAMISFCAQQTVNDMLSGFFIVFEGLFNIGDWIKVDGFRGQVIEIGVRTTKVAIGNNIQIINNSELKTITIMARNSTGAICDVDIAYKEDAESVIQLIEDNAALYRNAIPEIMEGPYVDGVVELGASGVTIRIWSLAGQENVLKVERQMRRVTKQLFDDNNIEIPFTQVTIHTDAD